MLTINPGIHKCWTDFSLRTNEPLRFTPGYAYHLSGNNGCGKSSFISQVLLPGLEAIKQRIYLIYVEQLFHKQAYAIKAHAAFFKPNLRLHSEEDCLLYLLENLKEAQVIEPRPVYFIADESHHLRKINEILEIMNTPSCLIFCEHSEVDLPCKRIVFNPLTANLSEVYETL